MAGSPITASVGAGGANRKSDVEYVQQALNGAPVAAGGPPVPLDADGRCGAKTVAAILAGVGMQPGDIAVEKGDTVHHDVVASIAGDQIVSVHGNSDAQSILVKPKTRAGVWYDYRTV